MENSQQIKFLEWYKTETLGYKLTYFMTNTGITLTSQISTPSGMVIAGENNLELIKSLLMLRGAYKYPLDTLRVWEDQGITYFSISINQWTFREEITILAIDDLIEDLSTRNFWMIDNFCLYCNDGHYNMFVRNPERNRTDTIYLFERGHDWAIVDIFDVSQQEDDTWLICVDTLHWQTNCLIDCERIIFDLDRMAIEDRIMTL